MKHTRKAAIAASLLLTAQGSAQRYFNPDWNALAASTVHGDTATLAAFVNQGNTQTFTDIGRTLDNPAYIGVNLRLDVVGLNGQSPTISFQNNGRSFNLNNTRARFRFNENVLVRLNVPPSFDNNEVIQFGTATSGSIIASTVDPQLVAFEGDATGAFFDTVSNPTDSSVQNLGGARVVWQGAADQATFRLGHSGGGSANTARLQLAVPEPSSTLLCGIAGLALASRRRRSS